MILKQPTLSDIHLKCARLCTPSAARDIRPLGCTTPFARRLFLRAQHFPSLEIPLGRIRHGIGIAGNIHGQKLNKSPTKTILEWLLGYVYLET